MTKVTFDPEFLWGCATASYQVEGAIEEDGRKPSIWDTFTQQKGTIMDGSDGSIAVDQYHRYEEDFNLMADLGFHAYRFSLAWPRIIPMGTGQVNQKGIDHYLTLCKSMKEKGLKVVATLYHWDLPQILQDRGGWANRETSYAFAAYAKVCFDALGPYVDQWLTLNEPYCSAFLGYLSGEHAPGIKDTDMAYKAVHHLNLAHGLAVKEYRKTGLGAPIGIVLNPSMPRPATQREDDRQAALYARSISTDIFLYPLVGKGYPSQVTKDMNISFPIVAGDMECIAQPIDVLGVNYYLEGAVTLDKQAMHLFKNVPVWQKTSNQGWPVTPHGLVRLLTYLAEQTNGLPLYVTENGCSTDDVVSEGRVHDDFRCDYLNQHLKACSEAIAQGVNLKGYFVWSFIDNFEWAWGYTSRFGIVYVDYETQERIPKDSAYMMRDVISGYCEF